MGYYKWKLMLVHLTD